MKITIEIQTPEGARWMTTDADGEVNFWRSVDPPKAGDADRGEDWWRGGSFGSRMDDCGIYTGIPCENWRESLQELSTPVTPAGGGE
jgi:hypothetical protein